MHFCFQVVIDYKMRYFLFGCVLIFVENWKIVSSAGINFTKYHQDYNLTGYRCVPDKTAFEIDNVLEILQCGKLCYFNKTCRSAFYQPDSYKCIGCRVNPDIPTGNHEKWHGSIYVRTKPIYTSETDCKHILENRRSSPSGLYKIKLWKTKKILTVFCDMHTEGGGWTVFQNRINGSTDFYRNFSDYEDGFGAISGEFWLGLKYIQELANQGKTEIRLVVVRKISHHELYETYKDFKLLDGKDYKLSVNASSGNGYPVLQQPFRFASANGYPFSTLDRDMDPFNDTNCAELKKGGWWFMNDSQCTWVSLNGEYCMPGNDCDDGFGRSRGFYHVGFAGHLSLRTSRMSIRRY